MTSSDNTGRDVPAAHSSPEPDAHGQAALLLSESILHALVEIKSLTVVQAMAVVEVAAEVKVDVAEASGESSARMLQSLALLSAIGRTFRADRPG